jgi:hypothetical protein
MPAAAERARVIEGELKADIVQGLTGLPTLSIAEVTNWKPVLAELKELACKTAPLAIDADAINKPIVARSLSALSNALVEAGIAVELEKWDLADGKGLDDLLANGKQPELDRLQDVLYSGGAEALFRDKDLMQRLADLKASNPAGFAAVRASIRNLVSVRDLDKVLGAFKCQVLPSRGQDTEIYFEAKGRIFRRVLTSEGPRPVAICNFTARIVEDREHDDGAEKIRRLVVRGALDDGSDLPLAEVSAIRFADMEWIVPAWGTRAVVYAGMGTKDHLRAAMQLLSGADVPRRTVYGHTGWRKLNDDWIYLHAGGAIGPGGIVAEIAVSLPGALSGFELPNPPEGAELVDAVRASLELLRLGPGRVMFPLIAAIYRAVLGDTDFSLHLVGPTGNFKSEAAALAQQHFGAGLNARHLPANWSSTPNAREELAFAAKDVVLVVDDFCPNGSVADVHRFHRDADRLFRAQGNRHGRQRLRSDTTLRPDKPPRGLLLSTGEETPRGQSLRSRLLLVNIQAGELGIPKQPNPKLSACQHDGESGKYAAAVSGYVRWLAPQLDEIRGRQRSEFVAFREKATNNVQHARTPGIVAELALGLRYFLDFAFAVGAISDTERPELWRNGWNALAEQGAAQAANITADEPASKFLRLLHAALASGYAHVADEKGEAPVDPHRWGWRSEGNLQKPQGTRVGWLGDGGLYLEPEASFAAVERLARDQNESFAVSPLTLRRRLNDAGLLATTDKDREKLTIRKTLQSERREVLHIVWTMESENLVDSGTGNVRETPSHAKEDRPNVWPGNGAVNWNPAQSLAPPDPGRQLPATEAELGRLGRLDRSGEDAAGDISDQQQGKGWGRWQ